MLFTYMKMIECVYMQIRFERDAK